MGGISPVSAVILDSHESCNAQGLRVKKISSDAAPIHML